MNQILAFTMSIWLKELTVLHMLVMTSRCNEELVGPYNLFILSNEKCSEEIGSSNEIDYSELKIKKVGRKATLLSGNITFKIPFTNEIRLSLDVAKFGNGGWKRHYLQFDYPMACERLKTIFPEMTEAFMKTSKFTGCPVNEGIYPTEIPMRLERVQQEIKIYPYGDYIGEVNFYHQEKNVGCSSFRYKMEPKKKQKKG